MRGGESIGKRVKVHRNAFLIGVGVGVLVSRYGGDLLAGILAAMEEQRIREDLERRRIVDIMGDTVGYFSR